MACTMNRPSSTQGACRQAQGCTTSQCSTRRASVVVRAQSSELKRPELKRPEMPPAEPKKLFTDAAPAHAAPAAPAVEPTVASPSKVVTIEYQRQRAKEMTKYFQNVKLEEQLVKSKVFGWTPANEITNGRWVMFGLAVGALTEYATGVDFIEQLQLMVSYLGIADLD